MSTRLRGGGVRADLWASNVAQGTNTKAKRTTGTSGLWYVLEEGSLRVGTGGHRAYVLSKLGATFFHRLLGHLFRATQGNTLSNLANSGSSSLEAKTGCNSTPCRSRSEIGLNTTKDSGCRQGNGGGH